MRAILDRIGSLSGLWEEDACERGGGGVESIPSRPSCVQRFLLFSLLFGWSVCRSVGGDRCCTHVLKLPGLKTRGP